VEGGGNVCAAGDVVSQATVGGKVYVASGVSGAFVTRLSSSGSGVWVESFGGSGSDAGFGIATIETKANFTRTIYKDTGRVRTEAHVVARGRQIVVKLNGATIVDANLDSVTDPEVLKRHPGLARKTGHIGFLGHDSRVEFRNIRVKPVELK